MSDAESRLLAQHMGHDYNIHLKHYAKQTNLLERSKVAKVLSAISTGALTLPNETTDIDSLKPNELNVTDTLSTGNYCNLVKHFMPEPMCDWYT